MNMIISGLLVGVLLSSPAAEPLDIQNVDTLSDAYRPTYDLRLQRENANMVFKEQPQLMKIDELVGAINDKNRSLINLLRERTKILDKIQTLLDFRVYTRAPFNEDQLDLFTSFTGYYSREAGALQERLKKIDDDKELTAAKKGLLLKEGDYTAVINELTTFSDSLSEAISSLREINDVGNSTLRLL